MANNRIYYAIQQANIEGDGGDWDFADTAKAIRGLQSVGMSTNFNLEQVFQLGEQQIYEQIEDLPDVEVSLSKVLDGHPLMFHLATVDATEPTLTGRANVKCKFALGIWPDTSSSTESGVSPPSVVACSGMYIGSVTYNFPLEDNFSEDVTLVGNNKIWKNGDYISGETYNSDFVTITNAIDMTGAFDNTNGPQGNSGVNRRWDLLFAVSATHGADSNGQEQYSDATILPPDVYGITESGINELTDGKYGAHLSNITVSCDFGREEINELGRKGPYHRFVTFPVEVTCEIEVTSISGDLISATEEGIYSTGTGCADDLGNLRDRTIRIATCESTRLYLGVKNRLSSVNYSGGDAGGGNVSVTYSYVTYNDFTVMHEYDPNASGDDWWTLRTNYIGSGLGA